MTERVFPLASSTFCIEADFNGVRIVPRRSFLMPAVLSEKEIDDWTMQLAVEIAALGAEMKIELRKVEERPLFEDEPNA